MTNTSAFKKIKDKVLLSTSALKRIKIVKELFLEKLDNITSTLNQILLIVNCLDNKQDELAQSQNKILSLIDNILENQPFFFQSTENAVKGVRILLDLVQDQITVVLNQLTVDQDKIAQTQNKILNLTDNISENQPFLFQSTGDTVKGVRILLESLQSSRTELQQKYDEIEYIIKSLQKQSEIQQQFKSMEQSLKLIEERSETYLHHQSEIQQQYRDLEEVFKKSLELNKVESLNAPLIVRQSYFQGVEVGLMIHLYSFLPNNLALDIGANVGDISNYLLETGYEVYAFEPFPPIFETLQARFENHPYFHCYPVAIGSIDETRELFIVSDQTSQKIYQDSTLYNSLVRHSLCEGLVFTDSVNVSVKSLESLHKSLEIPTDISLVKIDTEGFDNEVLIGMGDHLYPVVMAEFWDSAIPFGQSGAKNQLQDMVKIMKSKGYSWHISMYRIWGNTEASYYCNYPYSIKNSWGNIFFFHEYVLFTEALKWCSATMPATYLST